VLTGTNTIASIDSVTVSGGDFSLTDSGSLSVSGLVAGPNISLNAGTIGIAGSLNATTLVALGAGSGGITLNTGAVLSGTTVDLSATGGGVTQFATGTITASTLQSTSGVIGSVNLVGTANAITRVGSFAVTSGNFDLVDTGNLGVAGPLTAANITLSSQGITVTGSLDSTAALTLAAGSGGIALNTGAIVSGATVDLSATAGGVTEVATSTITAATLQSTSGVTGTVNLAGTGSAINTLGSFAVTAGDFDLVDTGNLGVAGRLTAANITLSSPTITATGSLGATDTLTLAAGAGGIALNSGAIVSGATVDLSATGGGVTQIASSTITATTLQSTSGVTGTVMMAGTANAISSIGSFAVTSGDFDLLDTGNLAVAGALTARNILLNAGTIGIAGTLNATTLLALDAGSGGIALNTGAVLSGATVDVSATGGGVTQVATGTIAAPTLQSTSGVTGTVSLAGTGNAIASIGSFAVTAGNFDLTDTGNLGIAGPLTAANIILSSPTITATGSLGATAALTLAAGAGGIALNTGAIVSGTTVDLSATSGGVTQVASGSITAATLQSTSGVTGTVNLTGTGNAIASVGSFAVTAGDFDLMDAGNLGVAGRLTASDIHLSGPAITATGSLGATSALTLAAGAGGIALNSGAIVSATTVDLSATGGGVTQVPSGIITATTLQSTSGVTGTVNLAGTGNAIASVGSLSVTSGDFGLMDTANLGVAGPLTAENITLNARTIGITGMMNAGTLVALSAGSGGITETGAITAETLILTTANADATLGSAANTIASLGPVSLGGGALHLANSGDLTITGPVAAAGGVRLQTVGDLAIAADGSVSSTASGTAVVLAANGSFSNAAGSSAITTSNGRWLIYSQAQGSNGAAPTSFAPNGLTGSNYFNDAFNFTDGTFATQPNSGNRFVFGFQPTLTVTATTQTMTYNGAARTDTYSVTGPLLYGDTLATALSGAIRGLTAAKNVGSYVLTGNGLTSDQNYAIAYNPGTVTINPKALNWSVADAASIYGTLATPGAATLSGVVTGDTVAGTVTVSQNATPVSLVFNSTAGTYQESVTGLTGGTASNYVLANTGNHAGALTVNQKVLTWAVADAASVYGSQPSLGAATLTGLVAGDTVMATVTAFNNSNAAITPGPSTAVGGYHEIATALAGAAASNYVLASTGNHAGLLSISPIPVVIVPPPPATSTSSSTTSTAQTAAPVATPTAPAPSDAAPSVSAPVTATPEPVTPAPVAAAPVTPAPVTGVPVTVAPVTPAAVTTPAASPASPVVQAAPVSAPSVVSAPTESTDAAPQSVVVASLTSPAGDAASSAADGSSSVSTGSSSSGSSADGTASSAGGSASATSDGSSGPLASPGAVNAAVASGVASRPEAQARSDATANRVLASGGSPVRAAAASKQALVQLGHASSRPGPATASQHLGDSLAGGKPVAGGAALGAALARGVSPAVALARAAAREATTSAMQKAASVPQSVASLAAGALSQGHIGSQPGAAAMIAALAGGRDPAAAMARALQSVATRNAMQQDSIVALTPTRQDAAGLATGDTGKLGTAMLSALAHNMNPEAAAAAAARAEREKQFALKQSQTPATDARAATLAAGIVPGGTNLMVRHGVTTLVPDHSAEQLSSAAVPVPQGDPVAALSAGTLPDGVQPTQALSMAVVKALRHGETLAEAIAHAGAGSRADDAASAARVANQDALATALATGQIDKDTLATLAAGTDLNRFMKIVGNALQHGASPRAAVSNALANSRDTHSDDEITKQ